MNLNSSAHTGLGRWLNADAVTIAPLQKASADGGDRPVVVERVLNHVYYYAPVNDEYALRLMQFLRQIDSEHQSDARSRSIPGVEIQPPPIFLHICSGGGDLFSGFSLADQIPQIETPIITVIEGLAASAATLVSMSGARRLITPNSFMLIHQLSSVFWGTHAAFQDEMKLQEMAMQRLRLFYTTRSSLTEEQVDEALKRDFWMDAQQAKDLGLVDGISGELAQLAERTQDE